MKLQGSGVTGSALAVYNPAVDLDARTLALRTEMQHLASSRQKHTGLLRKAKWAIYENDRFKKLVEDLTDLLDDLENFFPATKEKQRELCEDEISAIDAKGDLPLLRDVAAEQDHSLMDVVKKAL